MTAFFPALLISLGLLLSFQDPLNDATGDGSLVPPTAAVYRSPDTLDVTGFELQDSTTVQFSLSFASLGNPHNLPNGFSLPIIEIYVQDDDQVGGSNVLLPGSGMQLAAGSTWRYAFQLNGDRVRVFEATEEGVFEDITVRAQPNLSVDASTIRLTTSVVRPDSLELYGVVGNYAPFSQTGWRSISTAPSPWSYSSPSQQFPVVDVLAATASAQQSALQSGILPAVGSSRPSAPPDVWVLLMLLGLVVALSGLITRILGRERDSVYRTDVGARQQVQKKAAVNATTGAPAGRVVTGIPAIDWDAPELNQNINDIVARKKSGYKATPLQQRAAAQDAAADENSVNETALLKGSPSEGPTVSKRDVIDLRTAALATEADDGEGSVAEASELVQPRKPATNNKVNLEGEQTVPLTDTEESSSSTDSLALVDEVSAAETPKVSETVETIRLKANRIKAPELPALASPAPVDVYSLKTNGTSTKGSLAIKGIEVRDGSKPLAYDAQQAAEAGTKHDS